MANTDEPAYMLQARAYARNGLGKLSTFTVASLLERIDTLEAEAVRLKRTAANDAVMAAEALEAMRADLADTVEAALQLP